MQTVSLTDEQKEKAEHLLTSISNETTPTDLINEWKATPNRIEYEVHDEGFQWVSVDSIVGTERTNINRFEKQRFERVLEKLLNGEFKQKHRFPPVLCKIDGQYYVDADGNHRVLAHKCLGIDEIYAEVVFYV